MSAFLFIGSAVALCLGVVILGLAAMIFNRLIDLKQETSKAWANIDVVLKQRFDEIPKLVEVCNQYMSYEKDMIEEIMSKREQMVRGSKEERIVASKAVGEKLKGLFAVGESYPELKSNENFMQIQQRVSDLEVTLTHRREYYNSAVTNYNTRIQQIPYLFLAAPLGHSAEPLFKVSEEEKVSPEMNFKKVA